MEQDIHKLTDEQVLAYARDNGDEITKRSLALFDDPSVFFTTKENVDYKEAYRLLRQALENGMSFSVGLSIPDKDVSRSYCISVY